MSQSQSFWCDFPPFPLPQHSPSLLYPSHSDEQPHDPRTEGRSGRLAVESPLTGYEPNATVEMSSAEVTPILLPSRRASFCSVYISCEDVTTTLMSQEVDERQSMGMLASPLLMQKREASAAPARTYDSTGESSMSSSSSLSKRRETCRDVLTQTEIEQRPKKRAGDTFRNRKNTDRTSRSSGSAKITSR